MLSCLVSLVAVLPFPTVQEAPTPDEILPGYWRGALIRDGSLLFADLEFHADDPSKALLSLEEWGFYRAAVPCSVDGETVKTSFLGAPMELLLDTASAEMRGTLQLGADAQCQVHFKRVPHAPAPFFREEPVRFPTTGAELAGSVILPVGEGPFPAVVLVAGRSYGSRQSMLPFATLLARHGVASIAFDGRGRGESGGEALATTRRDRLDDVHAAYQVLAGRDDVDAARIGLLGESTGGWLIPEVALENPEVAFLILIVGPAENLVEQQAHVPRYRMLWSGEEYSEEEMAAAEDYQRRLTEHLIAHGRYEDWRPEVERVRNERWAKWVDTPANFDGAQYPFYWNQPYDSDAALRQTTVPLLAVYGGADFVVPPDVNAPKLRRHLTEAGNQDFEILTFAGADHNVFVAAGFQGDGEFPQRYYRWQRPAPGYFEALARWVTEHVGE